MRDFKLSCRPCLDVFYATRSALRLGPSLLAAAAHELLLSGTRPQRSKSNSLSKSANDTSADRAPVPSDLGTQKALAAAVLRYESLRSLVYDGVDDRDANESAHCTTAVRSPAANEAPPQPPLMELLHLLRGASAVAFDSDHDGPSLWHGIRRLWLLASAKGQDACCASK